MRGDDTIGLPYRRALIAFAGLAWCVSARASAIDQYEVTVAPALAALQVKACFAGALPARLTASAPQAERFLSDARSTGPHGHPLQVEPAGIALAGDETARCIAYEVDLAAAARAGLGRFAQRWGRDLTTTPSLWLWRRDPAAAEGDIEVRFDLPPGIQVSVPWQPLTPSGKGTVYRVGATPEDWPGIVAFGRFQVDRIVVPGAVLRVARIDADPPGDPLILQQWITHAAGAVATLYGEFPLPSPQLLLFARGRADEPVPWGMVVRGGGAAAQLYFDQYRPLADLDGDWTAVHELSHMLLPMLDDDYTWLAEGFASYYQNVLRARAGLLSETQAWRELVGGFERGRRDTRDGESLLQTTRNMRRERAYMRVYWSGAAFVLLADLRLRADGRQSLDTVLEQYKRCCLPTDRLWTGPELLARLDAIAGTPVFTPLATQLVSAQDFPDLRGAYRTLGLDTSTGALRLDPDPQAATLRAAILRTHVPEHGPAQ